MLLGEEMSNPTRAGERDDVYRVVSCAGEGVGCPARHPSEIACLSELARIVELKLQTARDHQKSFVHGVVPVEDRARGPTGKRELANTDRTVGVFG